MRSCFFPPVQPQWCPWWPGSGCHRANRHPDINVLGCDRSGQTRSVRRSCRSCAEPGAARRGRRGASSAPGAPHPLLPRRAPPHLLHRRSTRLCQQSHGRSTVRLIGERSERQGEQRGGARGGAWGAGFLAHPVRSVRSFHAARSAYYTTPRSTRLCQQSHGRSTVRLIGERSEPQGEQLWRRAGRRVGRGLLGAPGALRPPLRRPLHLLPPCAPS